MQIGSIIHNFRITNVRSLSELNCSLWELEHEKTGTPLAWLDRADENKTFAITFKTIPEDSTGVFHILEHSVLCGSDKYPVKEPFVELLKSSVNTFLNAMTYPDKTVYPFSSRNNKDFLNLLDVYMDAVLHPAIYHKPEIFRQEGWHYELREGQEPVYQGVVFNEMKGAYASADAVLEHAMNRQMFPDNCYSAESGGHPEHIPDLTYEQFIANHRKFYHPSNSRIILNGSVDLDSVLAHIDLYLKDYDRHVADFQIPMQAAVPYREERTIYEIGTEESTSNRTIVSCGCMLGCFNEQEKLYAATVLKDYLAGDNDAPLKQAVLSAGLGQDVKVRLHDGIQQNWISWEVWNTDEDKVDEIKAVVNRVLTDLAENGLDKGRLEACFNRFAFQLRDKDGGWASRSLSEALTMLDSWLYGGDPAQYLLTEDVLNALEAKLDSAYFADLIRTLFLENLHKAMSVLVPSQTLGKEKQEKEAARVAAECAAWTDADRVRIEAEGKTLAAWQQTADTPEALNSIPVLKLSDIDPTPEKLPVTVSKTNGITVLTHDIQNGLTYLNLHFDVSDLSMKELPVASLLTKLLGKLPTVNYSSAQLQMLTKQKVGKLRFIPNVYSGKKASVHLSAEMVCLANQGETAVALLCEILTETLFEDKLLLKNLLNQIMMQLQMEFVGAGHQYAMTRACSMLTGPGAAKEAMVGSSFIQWVKAQCAANDGQLDELAAQLKAVAGKAFCAKRLTVSLSSNAEKLIDPVLCAFPKGSASGSAQLTPNTTDQIGLPIPAPIGFASKASNIKNYGGSFHGSIYVLTNVLNFSYLWNEIRVQGGAYGCGFAGRDDGDMFFYTYRDPQPGRSLNVFDKAVDFIRSFCAQKMDLTPMILGSMASADPLLNTQMKITVAENRYFKGITYEDVCRVRHELISTTHEDLLALTDVLKYVAEDNAVCIVAGQPLLEACGELISKIQPVL